MTPRPRLFDVAPGFPRHPFNNAAHNAGRLWQIDAIDPLQRLYGRLAEHAPRQLLSHAEVAQVGLVVLRSFTFSGGPGFLGATDPVRGAVNFILSLLWEAR